MGYPVCDLYATRRFPIARRREWEGALNEPEGSERRRKLEKWLDRGHGQCWLRQSRIAGLVEARLRQEVSASSLGGYA